MTDVWRVTPAPAVEGEVPKWNIFFGMAMQGIWFESREEAEDFVREQLDEGWSSEWMSARRRK